MSSACPATLSLADPAVQQCPYPMYATLHRDTPVYFDATMNLYLITRYEDVVAASLDWETFSSQIDMRRDVAVADVSPSDELYQREGWVVADVLSQVDPPRHTIFRRIVERLFTGPAVKRLHAYLDAHVCELIDGFAGRGEADFLAEFALPLPIDVIADQLGLPRAAAANIKRWTDAYIESFDPTISAEHKLECARRIIEFQKYFIGKRAEKISAPAADLLSMLAVAERPDGARLSDEEYLALCAQLMVAGNETTRNHLMAAMLMLIDDPALQQQLRGNAAMIARFIDESLRLESPAQGLYRRCTREVTISGTTIPAGAIVLLMFAAGNRDERQFPNPAALDLERPNAQRHLAFGHGIHSCIGRTLATAELTIAFTRLLEKLDNIRLRSGTVRPRYKPHFNMRALESLPIEFTARTAPDHS
ncbi:MAG: cytochrome P450 [Gammaproteobacteria bacterium]|nr:cytochrome P450 [Gammaproteobacteria bacterium]